MSSDDITNRSCVHREQVKPQHRTLRDAASDAAFAGSATWCTIPYYICRCRSKNKIANESTTMFIGELSDCFTEHCDTECINIFNISVD